MKKTETQKGKVICLRSHRAVSRAAELWQFGFSIQNDKIFKTVIYVTAFVKLGTKLSVELEEKSLKMIYAFS